MMSDSLMCISNKLITSKKNGKQYYMGYFKDPSSGDVAQLFTAVKDGSNPPVVGEEYPVRYSLRVYNNSFQANVYLDPDYVS